MLEVLIDVAIRNFTKSKSKRIKAVVDSGLELPLPSG